MVFLYEYFKIGHRDIKPANILVDKKRKPMFCDFDVSQVWDEDSSKKTNFVTDLKGTIPYLSPEMRSMYDNIIDSKLIDQQKSDVFSLGITILEFLNYDIKNLNKD